MFRHIAGVGRSDSVVSGAVLTDLVRKRLQEVDAAVYQDMVDVGWVIRVPNELKNSAVDFVKAVGEDVAYKAAVEGYTEDSEEFETYYSEFDAALAQAAWGILQSYADTSNDEIFSSKTVNANSLGYELEISEQERRMLAWATDRGYWSDQAYDSMYLIREDNDLQTWVVPKFAAWDILALRDDDPDVYLASLSGQLLEKLINLEMRIG